MVNNIFIYDEFGIVSAEFVNIDLANDNKYFLNPYNIGRLGHQVAIKATKVAVHFFEQVRQALLCDYYMQAKRLFCNRLTEPKELCFGYAEKGTVGKGINELAEYILNQIYYIDKHLINEIKRIEDIKLFIDNIGDDRVSDIYANIIRGVLLEYTEEQCLKHGIPLTNRQSKPYWDMNSSSWVSIERPHFVWAGDGYDKLLVPKCFMGGETYSFSKLSSNVILPDLQEEELKNPDSLLVRHRKDNTPYVTKKDILQQFNKRDAKLNKSFARRYSLEHSGCVERLRAEIGKRKNKGKKN